MEQVGSKTRRRALAGGEWSTIIEGRVVLLRDFNGHSPEWNINCGERGDAVRLERLVEAYDRIMNNEPVKATRPI